MVLVALIGSERQVPKVAQVDREHQGSEAVVRLSQRRGAINTTGSGENLKQEIKVSLLKLSVYFFNQEYVVSRR